MSSKQAVDPAGALASVPATKVVTKSEAPPAVEKVFKNSTAGWLSVRIRPDRVDLVAPNEVIKTSDTRLINECVRNGLIEVKEKS